MKGHEVIKRFLRNLVNISDEVDTARAAEHIRKSHWFRGANVWILVCAIVLASLGLNINSTAVIIGAMLISPLMGPIISAGLAFGINDSALLRSSIRNLVVMVGVSLTASTLFFLISPLSLVNPTELEARTSPTIYDVMIALFGGVAGILENCRKEKGTVLSGVAIATALMPPLCTAGYGLAHWNMHFFFGAMYLFVINSVFIALATFFMVKYLRFEPVADLDPVLSRKRRNRLSLILLIVVIPSIWSAFKLVEDNRFERDVNHFVEDNRFVSPRTYIYDVRISGRNVRLYMAGEPLTDSLRQVIDQNAAKFKIKPGQISVSEHHLGMTQKEMDEMIEQVYSRTDEELSVNLAGMAVLQGRIDSLEAALASVRAAMDAMQRDTLPAVPRKETE